MTSPKNNSLSNMVRFNKEKGVVELYVFPDGNGDGTFSTTLCTLRGIFQFKHRFFLNSKTPIYNLLIMGSTQTEDFKHGREDLVLDLIAFLPYKTSQQTSQRRETILFILCHSNIASWNSRGRVFPAPYPSGFIVENAKKKMKK